MADYSQFLKSQLSLHVTSASPCRQPGFKAYGAAVRVAGARKAIGVALLPLDFQSLLEHFADRLLVFIERMGIDVQRYTSRSWRRR